MTYKIVCFISDEGSIQSVDCAKTILAAAGKKFSITFTFDDVNISGLRSADSACFTESQSAAKAADAVLFYARPHSAEQYALTALSSSLGLYAHARAFSLSKSGINIFAVTDVRNASVARGGFANNSSFGREAYDTERYSELEIERVARIAYEAAQSRRRRITLIDCADMLTTSQLWRKIVADINEDYPFVQADYKLADEAVTEIALNPSRFDVILTPSLMSSFVCPLLSCAAEAPDACAFAALGETSQGIYGAWSGGAIGMKRGFYAALSAAMLLRHSLNRDDAANAVEAAAEKASGETDIATFAQLVTGEIERA